MIPAARCRSAGPARRLARGPPGIVRGSSRLRGCRVPVGPPLARPYGAADSSRQNPPATGGPGRCSSLRGRVRPPFFFACFRASRAPQLSGTGMSAGHRSTLRAIAWRKLLRIEPVDDLERLWGSLLLRAATSAYIMSFASRELGEIAVGEIANQSRRRRSQRRPLPRRQPRGQGAQRRSRICGLTARRRDADAPRRQQLYLDALASVPELEVHFGTFLEKQKYASFAKPDLDKTDRENLLPFQPWPPLVQVENGREG